MTYFKYIVLFMILLLLIGCGKKDPLEPTIPTVIMPLKVGNAWAYDMWIYMGPSQPPEVIYNYIMAVTETVPIDGETWYKTILAVPEVTWADSVYFINRSGGLYFRTSTVVADSVYLRFKYPAQMGDVYDAAQEFLLGEFGFRSGQAAMASTNISVTVPFATTNCYYQIIDNDPGNATPPLLHDYFRPELGMVKTDWQVYSADFGTYYTYFKWELREATLQ
jgi:hypothetical protein